mmetsp:Transcript_9826/g.23597  ORF Transcript_9826/g.23597 Transcript_9826/m.23597 type:complete len:235 (-) Transcript_9826:1905-2609(-)
MQECTCRHHCRADSRSHGHPAEYVLRKHRRTPVYLWNVCGVCSGDGVCNLRPVEAACRRAGGHGVTADQRGFDGADTQWPVSRLGAACRQQRPTLRGGRVLRERVREVGCFHLCRDGADADCGHDPQDGLPGHVLGPPCDQWLYQRRSHHYRPEPGKVHARHPLGQVSVRLRDSDRPCAQDRAHQMDDTPSRSALRGVPTTRQGDLQTQTEVLLGRAAGSLVLLCRWNSSAVAL